MIMETMYTLYNSSDDQRIIIKDTLLKYNYNKAKH